MHAKRWLWTWIPACGLLAAQVVASSSDVVWNQKVRVAAGSVACVRAGLARVPAVTIEEHGALPYMLGFHVALGAGKPPLFAQVIGRPDGLADVMIVAHSKRELDDNHAAIASALATMQDAIGRSCAASSHAAKPQPAKPQATKP